MAPSFRTRPVCSRNPGGRHPPKARLCRERLLPQADQLPTLRLRADADVRLLNRDCGDVAGSTRLRPVSRHPCLSFTQLLYGDRRIVIGERLGVAGFDEDRLRCIVARDDQVLHRDVKVVQGLKTLLRGQRQRRLLRSVRTALGGWPARGSGRRSYSIKPRRGRVIGGSAI
jgi:hypothetical protein